VFASANLSGNNMEWYGMGGTIEVGSTALEDAVVCEKVGIKNAVGRYLLRIFEIRPDTRRLNLLMLKLNDNSCAVWAADAGVIGTNQTAAAVIAKHCEGPVPLPCGFTIVVDNDESEIIRGVCNHYSDEGENLRILTVG